MTQVFKEWSSEISFTEDQIVLFNKWFENAYDLYHYSMLVAWLHNCDLHIAS